MDVAIDGTLLVVGLPLGWTFAALARRTLPWLEGASVALLAGAASIVVVALLTLHATVWAVASRALGAKVTRVLVVAGGALGDAETEAPRVGRELAALGAATAVTTLAFLVAAAVLLFTAGEGPAPLLAAWSALAAVAVAVTAFVPAYPLVGGRVARAVARSLGASAEEATRGVALSGYAFGIVLVITGVVLALARTGVRVPAGATLAVFGWMLAQAASRGHGRVTDELLATRVRGVVSSSSKA